MQLPTSVSLSISTYRYSSIVYLRNDRPVLWHVEVKAAEALQGARLRVRHEPAHFARAQEWELPPLAAGQLYTRHGECPEFDDAALLALKDDVPGRIIVELLYTSGELLAQQADDFKWLAFNTWDGGNEYPELLAALTLPHDPAVDAIVNSIGAGNGYADGGAGINGFDHTGQLQPLHKGRNLRFGVARRRLCEFLFTVELFDVQQVIYCEIFRQGIFFIFGFDSIIIKLCEARKHHD